MTPVDSQYKHDVGAAVNCGADGISDDGDNGVNADDMDDDAFIKSENAAADRNNQLGAVGHAGNAH